MLQWLRDKGFEWNHFVCDTAAKRGHLDILRWARENGCDWTWKTAADAALEGHLEVLKWALENGCTVEGICTFADAGAHLPVLYWLGQRGCEKCAKEAERLRRNGKR